ncbi:MAG: AmmeMemoRadiSam system protein B, partial [Clostridia bacterium]|nr:AmmeMemoRadiSam system protein B [Clostridia bacterium]
MRKLFCVAILFLVLIGLLLTIPSSSLTIPSSSYHYFLNESISNKAAMDMVINKAAAKEIVWDIPVREPAYSPISCLYFDEPLFRNAISSAVVFNEGANNLQGGIVPHHLLASEMIASFWKTVSQSKYDLVVIIGPDHNKRGAAPITTIASGFTTILGDVTSDSSIANSLIQENLMSGDMNIMETEHSISVHIPFVRYYMPDTKILPILIYGNQSFNNIRELSDKITEITAGKKVLYVASMDFSHYLPLAEANRMDIITEKALNEFDYESITEMTNDNLDSRPSALFLLYTMSTLGSKSIEKWEHSNSDIISKKNTGYTTSYFTFGFSVSGSECESECSLNSENIGKRNHHGMENQLDTGNHKEPETQEELNNPKKAEKQKEKDSLNEDDTHLHIIGVGDIMLGRGVGDSLKANGFGFLHPFTEIFDCFENADILFGNLEQPITSHEKSLDKNYKYILESVPEAIQGIQYAGFNMLSLANNHMMDYYWEGLDDTITILDDSDISHAGAGRDLIDARKPAIIEKKGLKIALLAYTDMAYVEYRGNPPLYFAADIHKPGVAPLRLELIQEDIQKVREQVDIIILSLHWGEEDSFRISEQQKKLAHELSDAGADIILGHHPHWFQGIEIYNGKPIVYSLGNFIFDQP